MQKKNNYFFKIRREKTMKSIQGIIYKQRKYNNIIEICNNNNRNKLNDYDIL